MSADRFLLTKWGGEFWRPKASGYTYSILEAGTFDAGRAAEYQQGRSSHSIAVPFDASIVERIGRVLSECDETVLGVMFQRIGASPLARAAPDLLEALEGFADLDCVQCGCSLKEIESGHLVECWKPQYIERVEKARAAIAKAGGK